MENGGASSDAEVLGYLSEYMFGKAGGLIMEGKPFGCSTISAPSEDGGFYLAEILTGITVMR